MPPVGLRKVELMLQFTVSAVYRLGLSLLVARSLSASSAALRWSSSTMWFCTWVLKRHALCQFDSTSLALYGCGKYLEKLVSREALDVCLLYCVI